MIFPQSSSKPLGQEQDRSFLAFSTATSSHYQWNVYIACLSEVRISDSGHSVIKVPGEEACYHLYHSGVVDNTGRHGVAIALSEAAQAALLAWVPISSRLASARLKGTTMNLTVVAVYAPTLDAAEEVKDSFYDDLQDAVDRVPAGDMLIVAGDWNA